MGHDIYAKRIDREGRTSSKDDISYLRIGASNRVKANLFYTALDAEEFDAGCSGCGSVEEFTREEINLAISRLKYLAIEDPKVYTSTKKDEATHKMMSAVMEAITGGLAGGIPFDTTKNDLDEIATDIESFFNDIIASGEDKVIIEFC